MKTTKNKTYAIGLTLISLLITCIGVYATSSPKIEYGEYFGIDISKWNEEVHLEQHNLDYVIIRLGYTGYRDGSTNVLDDTYLENIKKCISNNIPYGVYYYSLANSIEDIQNETQFILDTLDGLKPPVGIFLDLEDEDFQGDLTKDELTNIALEFQTLIKKSNNVPGIYANTYWWDNKLDSTLLKECILWVANYNEEYILEAPFHIHQYTDEGKLTNEQSLFDFNISNIKYW